MLPSLRALISFVAVMDRGSQAAAAEHLASHQANISKMITNLEELYEITLFEKEGGVRTKPTADAYRLLEKVKVILRAIDELGDSSSEIDSSRIQLRILTFPRFADVLLSPAISELALTKPSPKIVLHSAARRELNRREMLDKYDAVFTTREEDREPDGQVIAKIPIVAVMNKGNPLATKTSLSAEDLDRQPAVILQDGTLMRDVTSGLLAGVGGRTRTSMELSSSLLALRFATNGVGLFVSDAIIPSAYFDEASPGIVRPIETQRVIEILVRKADGLNPRKHELIEQLVAGVASEAENCMNRLRPIEALGGGPISMKKVLQ